MLELIALGCSVFILGLFGIVMAIKTTKKNVNISREDLSEIAREFADILSKEIAAELKKIGGPIVSSKDKDYINPSTNSIELDDRIIPSKVDEITSSSSIKKDEETKTDAQLEENKSKLAKFLKKG